MQKLSFDQIICYGYCHGIVAMDQCSWLQMSHFCQGELENNAGLAVIV